MAREKKAGQRPDASSGRRVTSTARAHSADQRGQLADERDRNAGERESLADERDRIADEREALADSREVAQNERRRQADDRERKLDETQRAMRMVAQTLEQRSLERIERSPPAAADYHEVLMDGLRQLALERSFHPLRVEIEGSAHDRHGRHRSFLPEMYSLFRLYDSSRGRVATESANHAGTLMRPVASRNQRSGEA